MSKPKIILVGAGGHCRSCIDVIEQEGRFKIAGIVDKEGRLDSGVLDYPVIGADADLPALRKDYTYALITVGQIESFAVRFELSRLLKVAGFELPVVVSPLAYVSRHALVGEGSIVMHRAVVNAGAVVGRNCILNTLSLVEHDATIGDYVHISTGAVINGNSKVGNGSFIGSGAVVVHGVELPPNGFVRAAALVASEKDIQTTK